MKFLRAGLAAALALAVVGLAPGIDSYRAAAQALSGQAGASMGAAGENPAAGAEATAGSVPLGRFSVSDEFSAPLLGTREGASFAAAPAVASPLKAVPFTDSAVPASLPAPAARFSIQRIFQRHAPRRSSDRAPTAYEGVSRELPKTRELDPLTAGKELDKDFRSRIGEDETAGAAASLVEAPGGLGAARPSTALRPAAAARGQAKAEPAPAPSAAKASSGSRLAPLFGALGAAAAAGFHGASFIPLQSTVGTMILVYFGLVVPSLILHEMGHALAADKSGDSTPRLAGRLSFKPKDLLTHIHPLWTIVIPLLSMLPSPHMVQFAAANPVKSEPDRYANPTVDLIKVAAAGPAVNFLLALAGGIAHWGLIALGVSGALPSAVAVFVYLNVLLVLFNLIPLAPMDGNTILYGVVRAVFGIRAANMFDTIFSGLGAWNLPLILAFMWLFGTGFVAAVQGLTGFILNVFSPAAHVQLAGAAWPALAGLGLLAGFLSSPRDGSDPGPVRTPILAQSSFAGKMEPSQMPAPVAFIVELAGARKPLSTDVHLSRAKSLSARGAALSGMYRELEAAGLERSLMDYHANPIATYRRINAATIVVDGDKAAAFRAALEARGYKVWENKRREAVRSDPALLDRGGIGTLIETAKAVWGTPETGSGVAARLRSAVRRLRGANSPQPRVAVIGSGAASTILRCAPWLKTLTRYHALAGGDASTDDILKAMTFAANDGNIIISNSWGADAGGADGPESRLAAKLAEEGIAQVRAPQAAGTLALLAMLFGVTAAGKELDALVAALMKADGGLNDAEAAYKKAFERGLKPVRRPLGWSFIVDGLVIFGMIAALAVKLILSAPVAALCIFMFVVWAYWSKPDDP